MLNILNIKQSYWLDVRVQLESATNFYKTLIENEWKVFMKLFNGHGIKLFHFVVTAFSKKF